MCDLCKILNGVAEDREAVAFGGNGTAGPAGMLCRVDVAFGMRHEAEDATGRIADARHVQRGPVGVFWIRDALRFTGGRLIPQVKLSVRIQLLQHVVRAGDELSFGMSDGKVQRFKSACKGALVASNSQVDPAVFKPTRLIPSERCGRADLSIVVEQDAGRFDQDLKAVANSENQFSSGFKFGQLFGEVVANLVAQYASRRKIVAIAEAAGDDEDLKLAKASGIFEQSVDMNSLGRRARPLEGERRLDVAISAGRTENKNTWKHGGK